MRFFADEEFSAEVFIHKHGLNPRRVREVLSGEALYIPPEMCRALSVETREPVEHFYDLNEQYRVMNVV
jgi:hypothetical protein